MISFLFMYLDLKYSGEENMIHLSREYYVNFPCEFDLVYYPFDAQVCAMDIEVQNRNDHYLDLIQDDVGISYEGNTL